MKTYTYEVQIGGFIKSYKTLAAARAKFAAVRVGGVFPDVIRFDQYFAANGEMCVYGEFESPAFRNMTTMIGVITREEVDA